MGKHGAGSNYVAGSVLLLVVVLLFGTVIPVFADESTAVQEDKEWIFELPANSASQVYERPRDFAYFWWNTDTAVQVELVFEDGTKETVGSEKEFSKKIVSVKFLNPESKSFQVKL